MTDFQVTLNGSQLKDLLTRDDGLQTLVEDVLNQVLEAQMTEHIGAGVMSVVRAVRPTAMVIVCGSYTAVWALCPCGFPRAVMEVFCTEIFRRYQRSEQALVLALMEMVVNGFPPAR